MTKIEMAPDSTSRLWPNTQDVFFRDKYVAPIKQEGGGCVPTCLAMLTGVSPDILRECLNTQDPVSWSAALIRHGMKLAYLPVDVRKLEFYIDELIEYDDLFVLGFYSSKKGALKLLDDPDESGGVCPSHLVILHRDKIIDPARGASEDASKYDRLKSHTKRVFRVVPSDHARGL